MNIEQKNEKKKPEPKAKQFKQKSKSPEVNNKDQENNTKKPGHKQGHVKYPLRSKKLGGDRKEEAICGNETNKNTLQSTDCYFWNKGVL